MKVKAMMSHLEYKQKQAMLGVERAIYELRSARGVLVRGAQDEVLYLMAAEMWSPQQMEIVGPELCVPKNAHGALRWLPEASMFAGKTMNVPSTALELAAIQLLKYAELLPVMIRGEVPHGFERADIAMVTLDAVHDYRDGLADTLTEIASASLPLKCAQTTQIKVFRSTYGGYEHLALLVGEPLVAAEPLVRIHSSCVTGDVLGSLRCDCGDQLQMAVRQMAESGGGILCYLQQEGRGIGIGNKIRAYALQQEGQDTREANESLGFAGDERSFALAAAMLRQLGVSAIRLMTNNPKKVDELCALGINVVQRVPVLAEVTEYNQPYLQAKATRFNHHLPTNEDLSPA